MNVSRWLLLLMMSIAISGCLSEDDDDDDYESTYEETSSGSASGSYDWSFTCPVGSTNTVPIPRGSCEAQYKDYARTYGCNDADNFNTVACNLQNCTGDNKGCR